MKHARRERWIRRLTASHATAVGAFVLAMAAFVTALMLPLIADRFDEAVRGEEVLGERGVEHAVWVVVHDGERLTGMVRVYSDTRTMTMRAVGYPPCTEIIEGVSVTTAAQRYPKRGAQVAQAVAQGATISFSVDGIVELARRAVGYLPVRLPQAVGSLPSGDSSLSPLQVGDVLRFTEWEQGELGQAWAHAAVVAACIRYAVERGRTEAVWDAWDACCESPVNVAHRVAVREHVSAYDSVPPCDVSVADGYVVGANEWRRYVLTERER